MSDVLIRGMEMPKSCNECPMHFYEGQGICSCRVLSAIEDNEVLKPWKKKRKDCPLVKVPPHGRLIDADALYDRWFRTDDVYKTVAYKFVDKVELSNAPTIIPAELPKEKTE